jgi:hypothetical protein
MAISKADEDALAVKFAVMRPFLDERGWRIYLGTEANELGYGGIAAVARASGAASATVTAGAEQARDPEYLAGLEPGRSRRDGAGRPRAEDAQPGLSEALDEVLEDGKRGDPMSDITWSTRSLRDIARLMTGKGFRVKKGAVARMMRARGWSLRGMSRVLEGKRYPGRDYQFRHISAMIAWFRRQGLPVISIDTKKKEKLGEYGRDGKSWRPPGDPVKVRDHDFPEKDTVRIAPYGIYDITANRGFVSVGTSHDTAAFAVNAIRLWWRAEGAFRYPGATRILVTCDAGGSNDHRCRLWKDELARLAQEAGLRISVCHFPPGTSKWNKIEHQLFSHITRTWSARPLRSIDDAVAGIAATVTVKGLKCTAVADDRDYPDGIKVSDERMRWLEDRVLARHRPRPCLNYTVLPVPRPAAPAPPEPERPGRVPAAVLAALAGIPPQDFGAITAAADVHLRARLEMKYQIARKGDRKIRKRAARNRVLGTGDYLAAVLLRQCLELPDDVTGCLLGVSPATVKTARSHAGQALASARITLPAALPPENIPSTPGSLLALAAAAGIPLTIPDNGHPMPEQFKTPRKPPAATRQKSPNK